MQAMNEMRLDFLGVGENEAFARLVISAFLMPLNPTVEEMEDVKTAVSEAVTNAIVHGYEGVRGMVRLEARLLEPSADTPIKGSAYKSPAGGKNGAPLMNFQSPGAMVVVEVRDGGCGIFDIAKAREPLYTSKPDMERTGMGFSVMEAFMDSVEVESSPGRGTLVRMKKYIAAQPGEDGRK